MTSFTRKLYRTAPAAAKQLRRHELHNYRYGKNVTLAQFTMPSQGQRKAPRIDEDFEFASVLNRWDDRRFR